MCESVDTGKWIENNVVYPYNGMLSNNKKEQTTDTYSIMDEPRTQYAKWKREDRHRDHRLYNFIYLKCPEKIEKRK